MSNIESYYPKCIVFMAEDTFTPLFWDDQDAGIGDANSVIIGDKEYNLSSLSGLEQWFSLADRYDPYSAVGGFNPEGMESWINEGYEYAKQFRKLIPKDIDLYYSFWHQFGDNNWSYCRAYIPYLKH